MWQVFVILLIDPSPANSHNNSMKDSPQKDVGLDAQKAARPLLLGVMHLGRLSNGSET